MYYDIYYDKKILSLCNKCTMQIIVKLQKVLQTQYLCGFRDLVGYMIRETMLVQYST